MTTTIHIEGEQPYVEQALTKIKNILVGEKVNIVVEPSDNEGKLTHEQLMALPEEARMKYYDAHGGVLAVMKENGYGLTEEDIKDWERYKEERDQKLASLPWDEAVKLIYGK